MKYHKKPPILTITEDDVELVADKVQDTFLTTEEQREEIMANLMEFNDTLQRIHIPIVQQT
jgi:hypothetical protein